LLATLALAVCGRFTLRRPGGEVARHFELQEVPELAPRYNAAPGQDVAVVRAEATGMRRLEARHWGLVPPWADDPRVGSRMINARSESAERLPAFAEALRLRRCLVPADGFFEWVARGRERRAFHVRLPDDGLFGMAGLWETWRGPGGEIVESCAILTTAANTYLRRLHDRMPVILAPGDYARWLDPGQRAPAALRPLLRPYPDGALLLAPVGPRVNRVENDDPDCLAPAEPPAQGELFG
jgi:putative SOS response-associated peptidase YedK